MSPTIRLDRTFNAIARQSHDLKVSVDAYLEPVQLGVVSGPAAHLKVLIARLYNLGNPRDISAKYRSLRLRVKGV